VSLPIALPDPLRSAVAEYAWMAATDGESGAMVYRLEAAGRPTLYVKHGTGAVGDGIMAEAARLDWLAGRLPVPRLRHFVRVPGEAYLLTEAVPGQSWRASSASPTRCRWPTARSTPATSWRWPRRAGTSTRGG
jgi:aminoglycoside 3'-phosphotransferase-1